MHRYVSLIWDQVNTVTCRTAKQIANQIEASSSDWSIAYENRGLAVFHTGALEGRKQAYPLKDDRDQGSRGVVLGRLFNSPEKDYSIPTCLRLNPRDSREIVETGGQYLVDHYWGRYVAFVDDQKTRKTHVIGDPIGNYPAYYVEFRNVKVFFSHISDITKLGIVEFSINQDHIAAHLKWRIPSTWSSGLNEVTKLARGERITISAAGLEKALIWNPQTISQTNVIECMDEAASQLRAMTIACVQAWASTYDRIVHSLSGGLDSSIVLSCLSKVKSHSEVTCFNYYTPLSFDADERAYARLAAETANVPLVEEKLDFSSFSFDQFTNVPEYSEPTNFIYEKTMKQFESQVALDYKAEAIFCGKGGDNIFYNAHRSLGASDYVRSHGIRSGLIRIMLEAARLQEISFWKVLAFVFKHGTIGRPWNIETEYLGMENPLLNSSVVDTIPFEDCVHPWIDIRGNKLFGKRHHIFLISNLLTHHHRQHTHADYIDPLMSQPLIELLLRIPSWSLTAGGKDRGLIRKAFQNDVPKRIISRESKGGAAATYKQLFDKNEHFIQEYLLTGYLAQNEFFNVDVVRRAFADKSIMTNSRSGTLLSFMHLETWCQSWQSNKKNAQVYA